MTTDKNIEVFSPLGNIEARMRDLLPAKLFAEVWIKPTSKNLSRVFMHLRTLQRILYNYLPRQVLSSLPKPGESRYSWDEGTLMFTDLSGFTPLMEGNAALGTEGAKALLDALNEYFTEMIQILSKSGGNLLEFTGDAILVLFPKDKAGNDTSRAIRAGLRMQRAMKNFSKIKIKDSTFSLGMRVGLHVGRFLTADIGTPHRMEHVLLGSSVQQSKLAEGAGKVGRVSLTSETQIIVKDEFRFEEIDNRYSLVVDDLTDEELGDYDLVPPRHRLASLVLLDHSVEGLVQAISEGLDKVEPLASFIPGPVLNLLIENASKRGLPPDFPTATIVFVNLLGLPDMLHKATPDEEANLISNFSRVMSLINAEVEAEGGVLKKITYHLSGPDMMIFFGAPTSHTNDSSRAARAALGIREIINNLAPFAFGGKELTLNCHIGMTRGQVFAAELGDTQGRREYNVMGNTVNTAARLMAHAEEDQILMSKEVYDTLEKDRFDTKSLEAVKLKGKAAATKLYELNS